MCKGEKESVEKKEREGGASKLKGKGFAHEGKRHVERNIRKSVQERESLNEEKESWTREAMEKGKEFVQKGERDVWRES